MHGKACCNSDTKIGVWQYVIYLHCSISSHTDACWPIHWRDSHSHRSPRDCKSPSLKTTGDARYEYAPCPGWHLESDPAAPVELDRQGGTAMPRWGLCQIRPGLFEMHWAPAVITRAFIGHEESALSLSIKSGPNLDTQLDGPSLFWFRSGWVGSYDDIRAKKQYSNVLV